MASAGETLAWDVEAAGIPSALTPEMEAQQAAKQVERPQAPLKMHKVSVRVLNYTSAIVTMIQMGIAPSTSVAVGAFKLRCRCMSGGWHASGGEEGEAAREGEGAKEARSGAQSQAERGVPRGCRG